MRISRRAFGAVGAAAVLGGLAVFTTGCTGDDGGGDGAVDGAVDQVITVNWGTEPPSLDPGLATDTTSSDVITNIMDPLVKLGDDLEPVPNLADSWDVSPDGKTVTFNLRGDGRWTNGDPVTAEDFEWSWKRTVSPDLAADYAYQFFGIAGAEEYNSCKRNCAALRDRMGVEAVDERTLEVTLTSPQPWFVQQVAHQSFIAVHRPTVEQFGNRWTEAANIVTNGPFRLARWQHNARLDLVKWEKWRNADEVSLQRINGRMISEGTTVVQAFEAGELDMTAGLPPEELGRLKDTAEYAQYPALGTYYYGINVESVPDVDQRRAMALAIDRRAIIDNIAQADQLPATGFTPQGMPGFKTFTAQSQWLPESGDMERAKELMSGVQSPNRNITIYINDSPGHREIAVAIQAMWRELGLDVDIRQQEWAQFLEFLGPPPDASVDVYRLGWIADYVDAMNFLELWTCNSGNNNSNFCDPEYDRLVAEARRTPDNEDRYEIYAQLEDKLVGDDGAMNTAPIYWYTFVQLERSSIKESLEVNPLSQTDYSKVVETDASAEA